MICLACLLPSPPSLPYEEGHAFNEDNFFTNALFFYVTSVEKFSTFILFTVFFHFKNTAVPPSTL